MQVAYARPMDGESLRRARRREKLEQLLKEIGGPTQAELETGTPRTHFVAMSKGRRGVGDALAAKLEAHFGKPAGWFDQGADSSWPFSEELRKKVLALKAEELIQLETVIRAALRMREQIVSLAPHTTQTPSIPPPADAYSGTSEEGAGLPEHMTLPASRKHDRKQDRGRASRKGGRGA